MITPEQTIIDDMIEYSEINGYLNAFVDLQTFLLTDFDELKELSARDLLEKINFKMKELGTLKKQTQFKEL